MKFNEDFVPATFDEAVRYILEGLTEKDKQYILKNNSSSVHFGFGMGIRNNFSLWEKDSLLVQDIIKRFDLFGHGDDNSSLILEAVWANVKGLNVEEHLDKKVESFKKHWLKQGLDPKTGEDLPNAEEIRNKTQIFKIDKNGDIDYE